MSRPDLRSASDMERHSVRSMKARPKGAECLRGDRLPCSVSCTYASPTRGSLHRQSRHKALILVDYPHSEGFPWRKKVQGICGSWKRTKIETRSSHGWILLFGL